MRTLTQGSAPGVEIEVLIEGEGPNVVLLPSAGRGAEDFGLLQQALAGAGYRSLAVNFRGAGGSSKPDDSLDFRTVAADVAAVIDQLAHGRAHLVGHALGNTVARAVASYHRDLVRTVTVMPAGGHDLVSYPPDPTVMHHFARCHDESLPDDERVKSIAFTFFAPGNDASCWLHGWYPEAGAVSRAMQQSNPDEWATAGEAPVLIMHPLQDAMLPRIAGRRFALQLGDRAQYVELPDCGHAVLPEQPDLVAANLVSFLRAHADSTQESKRTDQ